MIRRGNILVTGGAGFIGSNLCEKLLELENKVVCVDNFSTGKKENIEEFLSNPDFTLIEGDIRSLDICRKAVKDIDYVLHEAALGSVPRSIEDPITTNEVNISGFLNILIASRDARIKRFIYAASSSTYGDLQELPKTEDRIGKPLSPYAVTKYVNELYATVFAKLYSMETIGLRYFNVFGKRQDPDSVYAAVIPKFLYQLINHESPVINGDGSYSRDFTYIENVIQMNLLSLSTTNPKAVNQVYNTAYGESCTLNHLIGYMKEYLSEYDPTIKDIEVKNIKTRLGDIPHSMANIQKAKELLGYSPQYDLKDGLKKSIEYLIKNSQKGQP